MAWPAATALPWNAWIGALWREAVGVDTTDAPRRLLTPPQVAWIWQRIVAADGARFVALDDAARHDLRKRLKRLRYSLEFVAPLFGRKAVARYAAAGHEIDVDRFEQLRRRQVLVIPSPGRREDPANWIHETVPLLPAEPARPL